MKHFLLLLALNVPALAVATPALAQETRTLASKTTEVYARQTSGHSPTDEDINEVASLKPAPNAADLGQALPGLLKLLDTKDPAAHTFTLTVLTSLESHGDIPASATVAADAPPQPTGPLAFSAEIARILTPSIPQVAAHLTDDLPRNQVLTATILGGFTPNPPAALFPPMYSYLRRDKAPEEVGVNVVQAILQLGPLSMESAVALGRYLHRSDQNSNSRANLVDAIAGSPNQLQPLNKTLLEYLASDDDSLRARVILSLPQLDLAPDVFSDTRIRVQQLAENTNENLQVINAAKAVAPCWTAVKMPTGCPVYQ